MNNFNKIQPIEGYYLAGYPKLYNPANLPHENKL